jgi:predicted permease
MVLLACAVIASAAFGVLCERRGRWARPLANRVLLVMLYVLVPFVAYVNIAHLQITAGVGIGLLVGYVGLAATGILVWWLVKRTGASRATIGGMIAASILINTGYMGDPLTVVLFGARQLPHALMFDQLVAGPAFFTAGFAVAAAFGERGDSLSVWARTRTIITRNPPLWGVIVGLIVPASLAPEVLVSASHVLLDLMMVGGFYAVGVTLANERRKIGGRLLALPDRPVRIALACRLTVAPAIMLAVAATGVAIPSAYILQSFMPSAVNALILGTVYGLDQRRIADAIVWSTLLVLCVGVVFSVV